MSRVLVVTNDFPPGHGGIESFVFALCEGLSSSEVVVYTSRMHGDAEFDASLSYPVLRDPTSVLLPTPSVRRRVLAAFAEYDCDRVLFGAAAPLGLLAPCLRAAGAQRIVGLTHGHEVWWARLPATNVAMRRIGDSCDVLTYVSEWCRERIAPHLRPAAAARMQHLAPGVDTDRFQPGCGGAEIRTRLGIAAEDPVAVCVGRMVPRKGQDTLVRAWPRVLADVPDARLLLVGDGPYRTSVQRLVDRVGVADSVILTGSVSWAEMPAYIDAGDVFAMPSRSRHLGLEVEALGIVALEAAATGLPVLAGDSGGAPDTVAHGQTGYVVDPRDHDGLAARLVSLLQDPEKARLMGKAARERVVADWTWEIKLEVLRGIFDAS